MVYHELRFLINTNLTFLFITYSLGIAVMEDNSNSPRVDDCGDGEEEEDREQGTDDKKSTSSRFSTDGAVCSNPPR